ncbi:hypothetical protein BTVI_113743 [Pitangus sulphuratus]|nr:hypothetical protein BTVI_113743 [Pitangus sulphuratus]
MAWGRWLGSSHMVLGTRNFSILTPSPLSPCVVETQVQLFGLSSPLSSPVVVHRKRKEDETKEIIPLNKPKSLNMLFTSSTG